MDYLCQRCLFTKTESVSAVLTQTRNLAPVKFALNEQGIVQYNKHDI